MKIVLTKDTIRMEESYKNVRHNKNVNFWMHITHGCFDIKRDVFRKKWIIDTYVYEEKIRLDYDFIQECPFEWSFPFNFYEFEAFNRIIRFQFSSDVAKMKYSDLMPALKWYKDQAISGRKLSDRLFIKFYGNVEDDRHHVWGRQPLDYDDQLAHGNTIQDVYYGVGLAAGNIEDWKSCFYESYGNKFMILKALKNRKYMFSGDILRGDILEEKYIDMSRGRQIIGMAFEVVDKGNMDEAGQSKLQAYMKHITRKDAEG